MNDRTTAPDAAPAGQPHAADEITPALLEQVLASARAIQSSSLSGEPTWFGAQMIAERTGIDVKQAARALLDLQIRGDILLAFRRPKGETEFRLVCALAEGFCNEPHQRGV